MAYQPINFANIAPQGYSALANWPTEVAAGMKVGALPEQIRQEQTKNALANAISRVEAKYKPDILAQQLLKAQIDAKYAPQLNQAEIALRQAQTQKASKPAGPLSSFGKALNDAKMIIAQEGENSPNAKQAMENVRRIAQGNSGITLYDPKTGAPMVQIGGGKGSSSRSGGQIYQAGNEQISSLTTPAKTQLQSSVNAEQAIDQYIPDILQGAQFQTLIGMGKEKLEELANMMGADFSLPTIKATASANRKLVAEKIVKAMGINPTEKNIELAQNVLEPVIGESSQGYISRITKQFDSLKKGTEKSRATIFEGIRRPIPSPQNQTTFKTTFKDKQEFERYKNSLNPQQLAEFKRQVLG